jgi:hypothetical protein
MYLESYMSRVLDIPKYRANKDKDKINLVYFIRFYSLQTCFVWQAMLATLIRWIYVYILGMSPYWTQQNKANPLSRICEVTTVLCNRGMVTRWLEVTDDFRKGSEAYNPLDPENECRRVALWRLADNPKPTTTSLWSRSEGPCFGL